jgi:hypothetical protein
MVKPTQDSLPDKKPSRVVALYLPAAFGILIGVGSGPLCDVHGYRLILLQFGMALGAFLFSWPFFIAGHHGYRFFRSFFERT